MIKDHNIFSVIETFVNLYYIKLCIIKVINNHPSVTFLGK